jgi:lipid-A-disaccharide synthase
MENSRIFISAGEASGERYGAMLIEAVRARMPEAQFFGLGGRAMEEAGCERIVRAEEIAVMGITEVVRHMPRIYRRYRALVSSIRKRKPALAVLIDFPDVNFRLARELKKLGIPVLYFVSPQIWAWKKHRIEWVRERVTKMLVIFPFEQAYYREHGVDAEFVGHPLADVPKPAISRKEFALRHGLDPAKPWIALLPGSRTRELRLNLPGMAGAAQELGPAYQYVLPTAATLDSAWVQKRIARQGAAKIVIRLTNDARAALHFAHASIVASGTTTVEAALMANPFVVVYRLSRLSYAVASRLVRLPHVAMVNLIANQRIVPELIQNEFTARNVLRELEPLLEPGPARERMQAALKEVRATLHVPDTTHTGQTAIDRAAGWVEHFLSVPQSDTGVAAPLQASE